MRVLLLLATFYGISIFANPVDFTADSYKANLDTRTTYAEGNVVVKILDIEVRSDKAEINAATAQILASGNVIFNQGTMTIKSSQLKIDMNTGLGEFEKAHLRQGNDFQLEALFLRKVRSDVFELENGKVTRCLDCPNSWSVFGSKIRVEVDEYAEIHNAILQVYDQPIAYLPYFIIPVKTKRQSGFLIPQLKFGSETGSSFALPYFWAYSESADLTFQPQFLSKAGTRVGTQWRWQWDDRSYVETQASYNHSKMVDGNPLLGDVPEHRFGYSILQKKQLSSRWTQRLRSELAGDKKYTQHYGEDFNQSSMPTLVTLPSLAWTADNFFGLGLLEFHFDNLNRFPSAEKIDLYHKGEIYKLPEIRFGMATYPILGDLLVDWNTEFVHFSRGTEELDTETNWIRTGSRFSALTKWSYPTDFLNQTLRWEPSMEWRQDFYKFYVPTIDPSAARARLFLDQKFYSEFWKVWNLELGDLRAIKHSITPIVRWTYAPHDLKTNHPFFSDSANPVLKTTAPRFDLWDPNPAIASPSISSLSEEQRLLHHHLITFGLSSRVVGRFGEENKSYSEFLAARVERDYNLLPGIDEKQKFSPIRLWANGGYWGIALETTMVIDTQSSAKDIYNKASYSHGWGSLRVGQEYKNATEERGAVRNFSAGTTALFIPRWTASADVTWDQLLEVRISESYLLSFKSLSNCWGASLLVKRNLNETAGQYDWSPGIALSFTETDKMFWF